ncbi:MAG: hypothetical protein ACOY90_06015 [Candidatus Zhuqueibacterota bacterium]
MFKKSSLWIERISNPATILLLLFLFAAFQLIFQIGLMPKFKAITGSSRLLDFELVKSGDDAHEIISGYGEQGKHLYNYIQLVDTFYPIAYSLLLATLICFLLHGLAQRLKPICLLPLTGALFDYTENFGIFLMLRIHPEPIQPIASAAHWMSLGKFSLIGLSIFIILILGLRLVLKFMQRLIKVSHP